jgi:nucleoside-diphosphate-sugar epimerase
MTTFIAGGAGFIGRRLVPLLAQRDNSTRLVSEFGMQYRPHRERVLQIINDIRKEEGLPQRALQ